jgi:FkbM family methyltransferase
MLRLRAAPSPVAIAVKPLNGERVWCRPGTSDPWVLWDVFYHEFQQAPPEIEHPRCVVDLGANVGYTTAYYACRYPQARVIGVEMDHGNYETACQNTRVFGDRCCLIHAAVWDKDGELAYGGHEAQGYRASALDGSADIAASCAKAPSRELTSLFDELGVSQVDFLKMDIEGAESVVFRGPVEWLGRVKSLKIELHPPMTPDECAEVLQRRGYRCRPDAHHDRCIIAVRDDISAAGLSPRGS